MWGMLDDSSLFHVASEVPSLYRSGARRPEASHGVVSRRSRNKIAGCICRSRIADGSHRSGRLDSLVRIKIIEDACGGSPSHPIQLGSDTEILSKTAPKRLSESSQKDLQNISQAVRNMIIINLFATGCLETH